jgi:hypothetical protein
VRAVWLNQSFVQVYRAMGAADSSSEVPTKGPHFPTAFTEHFPVRNQVFAVGLV